MDVGDLNGQNPHQHLIVVTNTSPTSVTNIDVTFTSVTKYFLGLDQTNNQMVNLNTIYTDRTISLNVPQLNVPNSSFRSSTTGPLASYRTDQVKSSMGTQQSAGPYAALPNHTPPTASVNNHPQQQPTAATTLGAPANTLPTIHSMGSFISAVDNPCSPGTDSNENDLAFLIQRIQNG